jgi:hypothetical protein
MWGLPSFRRRKLENGTTGFIMCFEQEKRKENFTLCLDVWKITDKYFSCILRLDISKFGNFTALLPADNQKKNAQWRRSITTEERLALTLRLFHISCNLLSPSSSEQLNTSQRATTFWLTNFVNARIVAGRSRTWAGHQQPVERRPMLIHIRHVVPVPFPCRAVPWPWKVALRAAWSEHGRGAAWHVRIKHGRTL